MAQSNVKVSYRLLTDPLRVEFINNNAEEIEVIFTSGDADPFTLLPNESITIPYEFPMCWAVNCPELDCPDDRYVSHDVTMTGTTASFVVAMSANLPMRLCYYPTANPSSIQYWGCEYSNNFGAVGNEHTQTITGLTPNTSYTFIIQTSPNAGTGYDDCDNMVWEDISCPIVESTTDGINDVLRHSDFTQDSLAISLPASTEDDWTGVLGSTPPKAGETEWFRLTIQPNSTDGNSAKYLFDPSVTEAWVEFRVQIGTNWTPTDNMKMPGFSSHVNGGPTGIAGGNGGGWAGLCKSWSARSAIVRPNSGSSSDGRLQQYVYHLDSTNFNNATAADHPCLAGNPNPQGFAKRQFGETFNGSPLADSTILDNNWHTITQYVKLNTLDASNQDDPATAIRDGELKMWLDGNQIINETGLHFTNNPAYHNIAWWFQMYHGGSADTSGTSHDAFFGCIKVGTGMPTI